MRNFLFSSSAVEFQTTWLWKHEGHAIGAYYNITLEKEKFVGDVSQGVTAVTTLSGKVRIVIEIPAELRAEGCSYAVVRNHEGITVSNKWPVGHLLETVMQHRIFLAKEIYLH